MGAFVILSRGDGEGSQPDRRRSLAPLGMTGIDGQRPTANAYRVVVACSAGAEAGRPALVPITAKTGIFCWRPLRANSPRDSVSKLPMTRSRVFWEITTCPG